MAVPVAGLAGCTEGVHTGTAAVTAPVTLRFAHGHLLSGLSVNSGHESGDTGTQAGQAHGLLQGSAAGSPGCDGVGDLAKPVTDPAWHARGFGGHGAHLARWRVWYRPHAVGRPVRQPPQQTGRGLIGGRVIAVTDGGSSTGDERYARSSGTAPGRQCGGVVRRSGSCECCSREGVLS